MKRPWIVCVACLVGCVDDTGRDGTAGVSVGSLTFGSGVTGMDSDSDSATGEMAFASVVDIVDVACSEFVPEG